MRFWDLDEDAVLEALGLLQITKPVTVIPEEPFMPSSLRFPGVMVLGGYRIEQPPHEIIVNPRITDLDASETLWHELRHAQQRERGHTLPLSEDFDDQAAYLADRMEAEAEATERMHEVHPLCVPKLRRKHRIWRFRP